MNTSSKCTCRQAAVGADVCRFCNDQLTLWSPVGVYDKDALGKTGHSDTASLNAGLQRRWRSKRWMAEV